MAELKTEAAVKIGLEIPIEIKPSKTKSSPDEIKLDIKARTRKAIRFAKKVAELCRKYGYEINITTPADLIDENLSIWEARYGKRKNNRG